MTAVALTGTALAVARVASAVDVAVELLATASRASKAIALAQSENREVTPLEMDGIFASDDAAMQELHASIAARASMGVATVAPAAPAATPPAPETPPA